MNASKMPREYDLRTSWPPQAGQRMTKSCSLATDWFAIFSPIVTQPRQIGLVPKCGEVVRFARFSHRQLGFDAANQTGQYRAGANFPCLHHTLLRQIAD